MDLFFYKSPNGNVGDDLNEWLWPRVFGDITDYKEFTLVGIGSVFDKRVEEIKGDKVIFGAGVRDFLYEFKPNNSIDVFFVRGPLSAKTVGNVNYITDAAYCLKLIDIEKSNDKKFEYGYVPYFEHVHHFDWSLFELVTGVKAILPTLSVEEFLKQISSCKKVYCSAMHGAILADVLRVPWARVKAGKHGGEEPFTSELKWRDWAMSLDLNFETINLDLDLNSKRSGYFTQLLELYLVRKRFRKYRNFHLSQDDVLESVVEKLRKEVIRFKQKFYLSESTIKNQ